MNYLPFQDSTAHLETGVAFSSVSVLGIKTDWVVFSSVSVLGIKKEWGLLASHARGMTRIKVMLVNDFMLLISD